MTKIDVVSHGSKLLLLKFLVQWLTVWAGGVAG